MGPGPSSNPHPRRNLPSRPPHLASARPPSVCLPVSTNVHYLSKPTTPPKCPPPTLSSTASSPSSNFSYLAPSLSPSDLTPLPSHLSPSAPPSPPPKSRRPPPTRSPLQFPRCPLAAPRHPARTSPTRAPLPSRPTPRTVRHSPWPGASAVLPKSPPPHLKSFLEKTLIARESPMSHPRRIVPRPVPQPLE